jgi:hypothetical protein
MRESGLSHRLVSGRQAIGGRGRVSSTPIPGFPAVPPPLVVSMATKTSRADLAQVLGDLAVELQHQTDIESTLQAIVDSAIAIVPGACWAGISLIKGREVESRASSDRLVAELDEAQASFDEGPCLSALREHQTVLIEDMAAETRWPRFTRAAAQRGAQSLLAFHCLSATKT